MGTENLPVEDKGKTYRRRTFLVGEDDACEAFMRHSREIVAILERASGGSAKHLNWAEWLFSSCADELAWDDNEEPGRLRFRRPPTKPASIYETMLRLQRLSEKWSVLYQLTEVPDASEKSTSPIKNRVVPATPKQQIRGLFDGRSASASQKLKVQVESLLKALKVQAVEIGEIVAAAEKWRARIEKTLPAKVK